MSTTLDENDFEIISKALDALESKSLSDGLMLGMLGMGMSKDKDSARADFEHIMDDAKREKESMKDQIILVRAKLIQMKRGSIVSDMKRVLIDGK